MTLDERVDAAASAMYADWRKTGPATRDAYRSNVRDGLEAAFPELFTEPPADAWIAPVTATNTMIDAARKEEPSLTRYEVNAVWVAMRNVHLRLNGKPE